MYLAALLGILLSQFSSSRILVPYIQILKLGVSC